MRWALPILAIGMVVLSPRLAGASRWALEGRLGAAWNLPLPLTVRQEGEAELRFRARWETRALRFPLYYSLRASSWRDDRAWALDLTHHKIHLVGPPVEIASFAVSHGYNLLTLQRLLEGAAGVSGLGAGVVLAHPESEVRGRRHDERGGLLGSGYVVAGPSVASLVGTPLPARGGAYASAEARVTYSWARVPVAGGSATAPNLALHVTLGLGFAERP